jgi:hypothetical protein
MKYPGGHTNFKWYGVCEIRPSEVMIVKFDADETKPVSIKNTSLACIEQNQKHEN